MAIKNPSFFFFSFFLPAFFSFFILSSSSDYLIPTTISEGYWVLLQSSIGVSAMHMQVLHNNKVVIFDRTDFGRSNLSLAGGRCRYNQNDWALKVDCTAHSILYDVASNSFRPLTVQTDTWCSSGAVNSEGTLIQTGGYNDGDHVIRTFTPCDDDNCDWVELKEQNLTYRRWYSTNQILPDGRIVVVGGRQAFSYEFVPKNNINDSSAFYLRFLRETTDYKEESNLYPFLHLLPDGNLFIFANRRSILLDYIKNRVIREFPMIPGEHRRNYPNTGSSVLLPLRLTCGKAAAAEVMICGGSRPGSYIKAEKERVFMEAARTCGRLKVSEPEPEWAMEEMPMARVMVDMLLLPTGNVILINGASNGTAGWEDATNPVFNPVLYQPNNPDPTRRFVVLNPSNKPRMYHSSAVLLPDGRILVGGSNPHVLYNFTARPFPTDLSLEAFYPNYLDPQYGPLRPSILSVESRDKTVWLTEEFSVTFALTLHREEWEVNVVLMMPSFTTHSLAMNQRLLVLDVIGLTQLSSVGYKVTVCGPSGPTVAPPGYYMLFVVHAGIPSHAVWVKVQ